MLFGVVLVAQSAASLSFIIANIKHADIACSNGKRCLLGNGRRAARIVPWICFPMRWVLFVVCLGGGCLFGWLVCSLLFVRCCRSLLCVAAQSEKQSHTLFLSLKSFHFDTGIKNDKSDFGSTGNTSSKKNSPLEQKNRFRSTLVEKQIPLHAQIYFFI